MDKKQYESPEMQVILTTGEDIITTSGGSGMANSEADMQKLCPVAVLRPGLLVAAKATRAPETEAAIRKWVAEG